jgi:ATP:ADP antiporter, AAA family
MSALQRYLNIRRGELLPVALAVAFFFFVLTAWFVVRPAREALGMRGGMDAIRWLFMGTAVITLAVNPIFGALVSRFRRIVFIAATYLFFAVNLAAFWAVLVFAPDAIGQVTGMIFYVWSSVFNLFIVMVFWALMADRFSYEQSRRLFGIVAVGGTLGAIWGSSLAEIFAGRLGTPALLLIGAGFLILAVLAAWALARLQLEPGEPAPAEGTAGYRDEPQAPRVDDRAVIGGSAWDGFRAVIRSRYLLGISAYVLVLAIVATFI